MERDGETTLRGRGDTERERMSLIRRINAAFGVLVSHWTVTPGGVPSASTDDAVSWTSSSCDGSGGAVAESEPFSDGVDIAHNFGKTVFTSKFAVFSSLPHNQLILVLKAAFVFE